MSDEKSIYPRIETGYVFTKDMNIELVEKINTQTFTQGSAILKIRFYNPKKLIILHLSVKDKVKKSQNNRMRNGFIVDVLTSVDTKDIVKKGGNAIEIYEGVIHCESLKVSPFKKVIDKLFELRQKFKDEIDDVRQLLGKLILNSLYGEQLRKDIEKSYQCKSENWMMTECDERVLDYLKINYGNCIVRTNDDAGLEEEV